MFITENQTENQIDHKLAQSILDRMNYSLQDLSLEFGDVVIPSGDISHQLFYGSTYSSANLVGYVNIENGVYYVKPENNHSTPECAALELLDRHLVEVTAAKIRLERLLAPDYI